MTVYRILEGTAHTLATDASKVNAFDACFGHDCHPIELARFDSIEAARKELANYTSTIEYVKPAGYGGLKVYKCHCYTIEVFDAYEDGSFAAGSDYEPAREEVR